MAFSMTTEYLDPKPHKKYYDIIRSGISTELSNFAVGTYSRNNAGPISLDRSNSKSSLPNWYVNKCRLQYWENP